MRTAHADGCPPSPGTSWRPGEDPGSSAVLEPHRSRLPGPGGRLPVHHRPVRATALTRTQNLPRPSGGDAGDRDIAVGGIQPEQVPLHRRSDDQAHRRVRAGRRSHGCDPQDNTQAIIATPAKNQTPKVSTARVSRWVAKRFRH